MPTGVGREHELWHGQRGKGVLPRGDCTPDCAGWEDEDSEGTMTSPNLQSIFTRRTLASLARTDLPSELWGIAA